MNGSLKVFLQILFSIIQTIIHTKETLKIVQIVPNSQDQSVRKIVLLTQEPNRQDLQLIMNNRQINRAKLEAALQEMRAIQNTEADNLDSLLRLDLNTDKLINWILEVWIRKVVVIQIKIILDQSKAIFLNSKI